MKTFIVTESCNIILDNELYRLQRGDKIVVEEIYNQLVGGKGDETDSDDVDQDELRVGIAVEMEHTDDEDIAAEISLDHLAENPKYYTDLLNSGIVDEPEAIRFGKELLGIEPEPEGEE